MTFLVSAVIARLWVRARPAARSAPQEPTAGLGASAVSGPGCGWCSRHRRCSSPMLLGWLSAFYNVPEGIAAPLAHGHSEAVMWRPA